MGQAIFSTASQCEFWGLQWCSLREKSPATGSFGPCLWQMGPCSAKRSKTVRCHLALGPSRSPSTKDWRKHRVGLEKRGFTPNQLRMISFPLRVCIILTTICHSWLFISSKSGPGWLVLQQAFGSQVSLHHHYLQIVTSEVDSPANMHFVRRGNEAVSLAKTS